MQSSPNFMSYSVNEDKKSTVYKKKYTLKLTEKFQYLITVIVRASL